MFECLYCSTSISQCRQVLSHLMDVCGRAAESFLLNSWKFCSCKHFEVHSHWHLAPVLRASFYLAELAKPLLLQPVLCSGACTHFFIAIVKSSSKTCSHQIYHVLGEQSELGTSKKWDYYCSLSVFYICSMSNRLIFSHTAEQSLWSLSELLLGIKLRCS